MSELSRIKKIRIELGNVIRAAREEKHISQSGLAQKLGMDRQSVYRIENALTGTTKETGLKIATELGLEANRILALIAGMEEADPPKLRKPTNPLEFFTILQDLGIEINFSGGMKTLEPLDADDLQELIEDIVANASTRAQRKYKKLQGG